MELTEKINALLRQAEATPFGEEADAFIAKAHELMERYSITQAMLAKANPSEGGKVIKSTLKVEAPYTEAKASLAFAIIRANSGEGVYWGSAQVRYIEFVAYQHDADAAIRLYNSLELQALAALPNALKSKPSYEHGKTFTNSFLNAYATRIGYRLKDLNKSIVEEMDSEYNGTLLPALVDKRTNVEKAHNAYWPKTQKKSVSVRHSEAGASQGRAAADRADVGRNVGGGSRRELG